jgi:hypothetical protein
MKPSDQSLRKSALSAGSTCAAFKQDFHSRQHRMDAPAGPLAKLAMTFIEGMPAAAQETRDVLLVHRNQMIEQGFIRFH